MLFLDTYLIAKNTQSWKVTLKHPFMALSASATSMQHAIDGPIGNETVDASAALLGKTMNAPRKYLRREDVTGDVTLPRVAEGSKGAPTRERR